MSTRQKTNMPKAAAAKTAATETQRNHLRPAPKRWQRIALIASAVLLAAWMVVLILLAWK